MKTVLDLCLICCLYSARARAEKKPSLNHMFSDVYDVLPARLERQQQQMLNMVAKYPDHYPTNSHE